jgi:hypothetical protein
MDTTRAQIQLHWTVEHPARSIVTDWLEGRASGSVCHKTKATDTLPPSGEDTMDLGSLYTRSLAYFGEKVHAIPDDQWRMTTGAGMAVWQLVATIALAQYRVALVAHGRDDDEIESQLPADPLGIAPKDGWDLAAERGLLAVAPPDVRPAEANAASRQRLQQLLPRVIYETINGGSELGRTLGLDISLSQELARFTDLMDAP